jgi:hypothetical protein
VDRKRLYGVALFLLVAALVPICEALVKFDAQSVLADPSPWLIGLLTATVRAVASAGLARLMERRVYFVPELPAAVEEP